MLHGPQNCNLCTLALTRAVQLRIAQDCKHLGSQLLVCSYDAAAIDSKAVCVALPRKGERTTPFGVNLMRSQVVYQVAQVALPTLRSYNAAPRGVRWAPQKQTLAWCTSRPASLACVPCRRWRAHCSMQVLHAPTLHLPHSDCRLLLTFQQPLQMPLPKTCEHQLSG